MICFCLIYQARILLNKHISTNLYVWIYLMWSWAVKDSIALTENDDAIIKYFVKVWGPRMIFFVVVTKEFSNVFKLSEQYVSDFNQKGPLINLNQSYEKIEWETSKICSLFKIINPLFVNLPQLIINLCLLIKTMFLSQSIIILNNGGARWW